jgi:hypothetical protein
MLCAAGAILLFGFIAHLHITEKRPDFIATVRPLFIYGVAALFVIFALPGLAVARRLRDPRAKNGFTYIVSNEGVRVEGSAGRAENNWTAFLRAREAHRVFSLFVTRDSFHVLPKRCFASPEDMDLFRAIVRANLPAAKLKAK